MSESPGRMTKAQLIKQVESLEEEVTRMRGSEWHRSYDQLKHELSEAERKIAELSNQLRKETKAKEVEITNGKTRYEGYLVENAKLKKRIADAANVLLQ